MFPFGLLASGYGVAGIAALGVLALGGGPILAGATLWLGGAGATLGIASTPSLRRPFVSELGPMSSPGLDDEFSKWAEDLQQEVELSHMERQEREHMAKFENDRRRRTGTNG